MEIEKTSKNHQMQMILDYHYNHNYYCGFVVHQINNINNHDIPNYHSCDHYFSTEN